MSKQMFPVLRCQFLITRPSAQAISLSAKLKQLGANCVLLPTLSITSTPLTQLSAALTELPAVIDRVIFTSANAVYPVMPHWLRFTQVKQVYAIGPATAQALIPFAIVAQYPSAPNFHSEGLLALLDLQTVNQEEIVIFSGQGGRDTLENTLQQRGAWVKKIAVYQRTLATPTQPLPNLADIDCIVSNSSESLCALMQLYRSHLSLLHTRTLVVVSQKMATLAKELGFTHAIIVAQNATDAAIIDALLVEKNRSVIIDLSPAKQMR